MSLPDLTVSGHILGHCKGVPGGIVKLARVKIRASDSEDSESHDNHQLVAAKKYDLDLIQGRDDFTEIAEYIANEAVTMRQLKHQNILHCVSSMITGSEVTLILPFMELGSVRDILNSSFNEGLPEMAIAFILRDVLKGLDYLHDKGIVHRSVRASHILLSQCGLAKLTGFRYACSLIEPGIIGIQDRFDYPLHVAKNNLCWLSPEFLQQNLLGYNERTDIYSVGVTACECANSSIPYAEMPNTLMLLEKLRGAGPKLIDSTTFATEAEANEFSTDVPGDSGASVGSVANANRYHVQSRRKFSSGFHTFVEDCTLLDANERPDAQELITSAFIKQVRKSSMTLATILESIKNVDDSDRKITEDFQSKLHVGEGDNRGQSMETDEKPKQEWDFSP